MTITIDGDVADTRTTALAYLVGTDGRVDVVVATYVDRMERRAGEWRIAARQCRVEWTAELQETTPQESTAGAS